MSNTRFTRLREDRQLAREGADWFALCFWAALLTALLLGSVFGHGAVSVAHGMEMPILQVEMLLPLVSK